MECLFSSVLFTIYQTQMMNSTSVYANKLAKWKNRTAKSGQVDLTGVEHLLHYIVFQKLKNLSQTALTVLLTGANL